MSSGCSTLIARSGDDLSALTTREKVHEAFGNPSMSGTSDGQLFEDFHTRRKIAEPMRSISLGLGTVMTFGVSELFCFPGELCLLGRTSLLGRDIRFSYDSEGVVTHIELPGQWVLDPLRSQVDLINANNPANRHAAQPVESGS
jgi:hypothetical protein